MSRGNSKTKGQTAETSDTSESNETSNDSATDESLNEDKQENSNQDHTGDNNNETNEITMRRGTKVSKKRKKEKEKPSTSKSSTPKPSKPKPSWIPPIWKKIGLSVIVVVCAVVYMWPNSNPGTSSLGEDWRSQIDPDGHLSKNQRDMVFASLKPILDKSSMDQDEGVSTLLILSPNEEITAKLARCLLQKVNRQTNNNQISTEIDLRSHHGGKLQLDSKLRKLLNTTDTIRAVLLRCIDDIPSNDVLDQLRLLFAYCDGENPVIPHRLIIMTATSSSETDLRENFKARLPNEHDFIDALMSRISGHTLYLEEDQKSIC